MSKMWAMAHARRAMEVDAKVAGAMVHAKEVVHAPAHASVMQVGAAVWPAWAMSAMVHMAPTHAPADKQPGQDAINNVK